MTTEIRLYSAPDAFWQSGVPSDIPIKIHDRISGSWEYAKQRAFAYCMKQGIGLSRAYDIIRAEMTQED